jgi:hypothetical protein
MTRAYICPPVRILAMFHLPTGVFEVMVQPCYHLRRLSLLLASEVLVLLWLCCSPPLPLPLPPSPLRVLEPPPPLPRITRRLTASSSTEVGVGGALRPFNLLSTLSRRCENKSTSDLRIPRAAAAVRSGTG